MVETQLPFSQSVEYKGTKNDLATNLERAAARTVTILTRSVLLVSFSILIAWLLKLNSGPMLTITMKPNTALCLVLCSLSLWCLKNPSPQPSDSFYQAIGKLLAIAALLIGLLTSLEYILNWNLNLDELLINSSQYSKHELFPDRMSPISALCIVLLGLLLLLLDVNPERDRLHIHSTLLALLCFLCLLAIVGYAFGAHSFYQIGKTIRIAWETAICILALSLGAFLSRPNSGFARIFLSPTSGGYLARKILPTVLFVPIGLGWLRIHAQQKELVDLPLGTAVLTVLLISIFSIIIGIYAKKFVALDQDRSSTEQRLRQFIEQSPYAVAMLDDQMRYIFVSQKWLIDYRLKIEDVSGKSHYELFPDIPEHWKHIHRRCLAGAIEHSDEEPFYRSDGSTDWIRWEIRPWFDNRGKIGGILIFTEDISNRKRNERAAAESQRIYRAIGESIDYGVWICAPDGRNTYASDSFLKLVGLTQEECSSFGWGKVLHPDDSERTISAWKQCVASGGIWDIEHRFLGIDGKWHPILARGIPVRDEKGKILCWAGINLDISKMKAAEKERDELLVSLQKSKDELETRVQERTKDLTRSNADLEQFAYVASHDLQTPLRHVTSYVQLLLEKLENKSDPEIEKWANYVVSGTKQMQTLISDLLTYSRVGRIDTVVQEVSLDRIVKQVIEQHSDKIKKLYATITIGPLPTIKGVVSQLEQLFQNLIENSLKFSKPGIPPQIEITAQDSEINWLFTIKDNGIGIDPQYSNRIFGMFQRLHAHNEYSGTGIGLAICKKIIELHGGKIWVDSTLGAGSEFHFTIPKVRPL